MVSINQTRQLECQLEMEAVYGLAGCLGRTSPPPPPPPPPKLALRPADTGSTGTTAPPCPSLARMRSLVPGGGRPAGRVVTSGSRAVNALCRRSSSGTHRALKPCCRDRFAGSAAAAAAPAASPAASQYLWSRVND